MMAFCSLKEILIYYSISNPQKTKTFPNILIPYNHILSSVKKHFLHYIFLKESCAVQVSSKRFFANDGGHISLKKKLIKNVRVHKKNIQAKANSREELRICLNGD